jgi:hypothetical protein
VTGWWNDHQPAQPLPDDERTCHLIARIARDRKIARSTIRKNPGAGYLHIQPHRHRGWPPALAVHMDAALAAALAS